MMLGVASVAHAETIRIDKATCRYVTKHVPDADVTYQPGRDAHGRAVVPADINASPINNTIEKEISIHLTNDLAKVFGIQMPTIRRGNELIPLVNAETEIGYITLQNGVPYLNGHPLQSDQQDQLAVLCLNQTPDVKNQKPEDKKP